jgi:putative transposase
MARLDTTPADFQGHAALRRGRATLPQQVYHVTIATRRRCPVFDDFVAGCAAARSFTLEASLGDATLMAWVLMPDHAHWLLQLGTRDTLARVVGRMKACSAREVNRTTARSGPLWDRAYHDHALRQEEDLASIARYIVANPLRAGLVTSVRNYPFWDAIWLL